MRLYHMYNPFNTGQLPTFDFSPREAGNAASFSDVAVQKIIPYAVLFYILSVCIVLMFHRATVQYSPVLHVVICMCSSNHAHSDHEQQLAKIMAKVGSSTSSPGVSVHEWLDEDCKESLNNEERINRTKSW